MSGVASWLAWLETQEFVGRERLLHSIRTFGSIAAERRAASGEVALVAGAGDGSRGLRLHWRLVNMPCDGPLCVHVDRRCEVAPSTSDTGIDGARPLPPPEEPWEPLDDADWSAQNRKINDLLSRTGG